MFKILKLNHIAIACKSTDSLLHFYKTVLKLKVSEKLPQPDHGVYTSFVSFPNSSTQIELLEPLGDESPIAKFVQKSDGAIHHFCFDVDNLEAALNHVRKLGVTPLGKDPKIGAHGNPVIFLHPRDCLGILTELEQFPTR